MSNSPGSLYRITFSGVIHQGYGLDEVKSNLRELCNYNESVLDKLFSGAKITIKSGLTSDVASKYKSALDQAGIKCTIEQARAFKKQVVPEPTSSISCPKCNRVQENGKICVSCGIVFEKYNRLKKQMGAGQGENISNSSQDNSSAPNYDLHNQGYFGKHQEQAFLVKALLLVLFILFFREYLSGLILPAFLLFPFLFLAYIRLEAGVMGRPFLEVLSQHITFMPVMYTEGEGKKEGTAWVTYSLILVNLLVFYGYEINVNPKVIMHNLIFIPYSPTTFNVPLSLFTSLFLHAGHAHLWGNMLFLWVVGTVVERRIGPLKFVAFYFMAGISACLVTAFIEYVFFKNAPHLLGASGAIAGMMGLYAVRCYFKSMVFPVPILGIFSLIFPVNLKVRLNALVIMGLFFLADLSGAIGQLTGENQSNIGHWAHLGGMFCGVMLGFMFKLGEHAVEERHVEIGSKTINDNGDLNEGEASLRLVLKKNPHNYDAMLLLAGLLSKFRPTLEAEKLYVNAMEMLANSKTERVATAFKEYYQRYTKAAKPRTMFRLVRYYSQQNDYEWSVRCLELLSEDEGLDRKIREKAMFQCAKQLKAIGKTDSAKQYYQKFKETFPDSVLLLKNAHT